LGWKEKEEEAETLDGEIELMGVVVVFLLRTAATRLGTIAISCAVAKTRYQGEKLPLMEHRKSMHSCT
jgi:hypothetical protein